MQTPLAKPLRRPQLTLPEEEAAFLRNAYGGASTILEYGTGGSTVLAAEQPGKTLVGVESDAKWLCALNSYLAANALPSPPILFHVDIGPTKAWGYPVDETAWRQFPDYALGVWPFLEARGLQPDVVLIDGRFRAACFLATLLNTQAPVRVLFDDYEGRAYRNTVERFAEPVKRVGRMAVFDLEPKTLSARDLCSAIGTFYAPA